MKNEYIKKKEKGLKGLKIDITGMRFGKLVAVSASDKRTQSGEIIWNCQCDCGKKIAVEGTRLRRGDKLSCGCVNNRIKDLKNMRFGMLTVVSLNEKKSKEKRTGWWNCKCDCGNEIVTQGSRLVKGKKHHVDVVLF